MPRIFVISRSLVTVRFREEEYVLIELVAHDICWNQGYMNDLGFKEIIGSLSHKI